MRGGLGMFETLFPSFERTLDAIVAWVDRWMWLAALCVVAWLMWRSRWRPKLVRRMQRTFEHAGLFVQHRKTKLFPVLIGVTDREDEWFYVFRYQLRPGMSIVQFEEKRKVIEAAFHAETKVFGHGGVVTIKVKKQPYPFPVTE